MENNNPGVVVDTPKPKSSKGLVAGMVICAAIGLAGAGFGGYVLMKGDNKNTTTTNTETVIETKPEEKELEESPITAAEAETILEKYIGENKWVNMADFFSTYERRGFTENVKLEKLIQLEFVNYKKNTEKCDETMTYNTCHGTISFDDLSEKYTELFGADAILERKDYITSSWKNNDSGKEIPYYELDYVEDDDSFIVYSPMGLGGTSPEHIVRKVISVKKKGDDVIGQLAYTIIDREFAVEDHDKLMDIATDNLRIYNFTLSPVNDSYALTAFERAE